MRAEGYVTRAGKAQFMPVVEAREFMALSGEGVGFCLGCGQEASGVEPDARRYECESCGMRKVYGLEELLMMELVKVTE